MLIATKTSKQASTIFAKSLFNYDLPSEWQLVVAGELLSSCEYGTSEPNSENGTIPIVGMKSIINGKINLNDVSYMEGNYDQYKNLHLCIGDILLNRTNSPDLVGKVGIVEYNSDVIFASYLVRLRTHLDKVDPYYLNFWLNHSIAQHALKRISTRAVSQANINPTEFRSYCPVPLPPLAEQQKIVKILRTWDDAIEKVEKLIVAHNKHLTFLMNFLFPCNRQLVINKKEKRCESTLNLTKFENWELKKLSEIGIIISGATPDTNIPEYWNGDIPWVTPSEVSNLKNRFLNNTYKKITKKGFESSSTKIIPVGSIIVCTRASVGECAINTIPLTTNQGFKSIIPSSSYDSDFIYYQIIRNKNVLLRLSSGSTFLEISKFDFSLIKILTPPLYEQKKISSILRACEETVEKLKEYKQSLQIQKRGLMQKLLTGQWHVKVDEM